MKIESSHVGVVNIKADFSAKEPIQRERRDSPNSQPDQAIRKVASEEILEKIKTLTENGIFSVRFEMHKDIDKMVIQIVDKQSGEVIRQFPSEELISSAHNLQDYSGLIINSEG